MAAITFVSGTPVGGALDSTRELALASTNAGHQTRMLVALRDPYEDHRRWINATVKIAARSRRAGRLLWNIFDRTHSDAQSRTNFGLDWIVARDVPAALAGRTRPGEVLVLNSLRTLDLSRVFTMAARRALPTIWYLRETAALGAVQTFATAPTVMIANSEALRAEAERLSGRPCAFVPSVISVDGIPRPSEHNRVLLVNPVESHGLDRVIRLATLMPDVDFALQESWPLDQVAWNNLTTLTMSLPNVELRRRTDRSGVFRDALLLITPFDDAAIGMSRPRTAIEAQGLGIPLIASDVPGLRPLSTAPELLLSNDAPDSDWATAIRRVLADRHGYSVIAESRSKDLLPSADAIWKSFVDASGDLIR